MKRFLDPARSLQLVALLTPPLAVVAPLSLAVVLPLAALTAGLAAWRGGALGLPPRGAALVMLAALAWSGASAVWAFEPALVRSVWFQIAGLAVAGLALLGVALRLEDDRRTAIGSALAIGLVIALTMLCLEWASVRLFDSSLMATFHTRRPFSSAAFNRGVATLSILVWPAALAVWRRHGALGATALILATFVVLTRFDSMAAIVAMSAGTAIGAAAFWRATLVARAFAAVMVLAAAAAPVLPRLPAVDTLVERTNEMVGPGNGVISIVHRLQIWQFTAEAVAVRPVTGWGLNAARDLPGGIGEITPGARRLPLHPHNAILQWWLELGAVGAALGTALVVLAILGAGRLGKPAAGPDPTRPAALAAVASAIAVALVGYGIWQGWWMAALWLAAALMAAVGGSKR
ncbi:MAG TPA: O-antigen ligase family protein [Alphaproteobacteria bacterium]|nr:O-antigen ligase family protein [Alphaproteobacteria bacterium]